MIRQNNGFPRAKLVRHVRCAALVREEDVDGGGRAAVNVGVTATGHVFHESNVASAKHVPGPITGANLDFTGQMNDQPAFGQGMEVLFLVPSNCCTRTSWILVKAPKAGCSSKRSSSIWLSPSLPVNTR